MSEKTNGGMTKTVPLYRWLMLLSGLSFISLYAAVSLGWLRPLTGTSTLARLEPFLFLFIGYYFGRTFSMADKTVLLDEIERQKRRADQEAEQRQAAERTSHFLFERTKNANSVLGQAEPKTDTETSSSTDQKGNGTRNTNEIAIKVAQRILSS